MGFDAVALRKYPHRFKQVAGTVIVTAVGMFGKGGGWGITFLPLHTYVHLSRRQAYRYRAVGLLGERSLQEEAQVSRAALVQDFNALNPAQRYRLHLVGAVQQH